MRKMGGKGNVKMRKEAYQAYKDGVSHVDNAKRLGVSAATVRSWCSRYKWKEKLKYENSHILFIKRLYNVN